MAVQHLQLTACDWCAVVYMYITGTGSNAPFTVQNAYEVDTACTGSACTCAGIPNRSLANNATQLSCYALVSTPASLYATTQVRRSSH